jgi:hypothetical protein
MKHFSKLPVIIFCYASNLRASLEASGRLAQGREVPATISADTLLPRYCSLRPPLPPVVIWRARGKAKGSDGEAEQFLDLPRRLDGVVARRRLLEEETEQQRRLPSLDLRSSGSRTGKPRPDP